MPTKSFIRVKSKNSKFTARIFPVPCAAGTAAVSGGGYWCPDQVVKTPQANSGWSRCHLIGSKVADYYGIGLDDIYTTYANQKDYGGANGGSNAKGATIYATTVYSTFNTGSGATPALGQLNLEALLGTTLYRNDTSSTAYGEVENATFDGYTHSVSCGAGGEGVSGSGGASVAYSSQTYYYSGVRTYTARASAGYRFVGWTHNIGTVNSSGALVVDCADGELEATANFAPLPVLTYDANGGSTTPSSQQKYGNVTLASAITFTGRTFLGWKIGDKIYEAEAPYNLTADATAVAQWTNISFHNDDPAVGTLSLFDVTLNQKVADESDGYIKYSGVANHIYRVDCTVSDFLYEKRGVYVNGSYIEPYQFTFSGSDVTGTYYYNAKPLYAFSVVSPHGTCTVAPAEDAAGGLYAKGRTITVTITPEPGYRIAQVTLVNTDNNDVYSKSVEENVLTLDGIAFNTRAVIDYSQIDYELSASIDTASASAISATSIEVGGEAATSAHYGDEASFSATVGTGFSFAGWYDADSGVLVSDANPYTPTVQGDIKLVAKAAVDVSISLNYTGADGNETCSLTVNEAEYTPGTVFQVILGNSFSYALTLGMRTADERWYLDLWKDGNENTLLLPLSDTVTPEEAIEITAYIKSKSATTRTLTIKTGRFGASGGVSVEGEPYDTIGDYVPATGGPHLAGANPTGEFSFSFYGVQYVKLTAAKQAKIGGDADYSVFRGFYDDGGQLLTASPSAVLLLAADRTIWAYYGSAAPVTLSLGFADADGEACGEVSVVESSDENAGIAEDGRSVEVTQGYAVTVRATPRNGYEFAGWYASEFTGGDPLSTVEEWTRVGDDWKFTVMYGRTIYAKFRQNTHAVCEWEGDPTPKALVWRSKTYEASKPFNPSAARVDSLGYEGDAKGSFLVLSVDMFSAPDAAPTSGVRLDNIKSQSARRLPPMRAERYMQIEVRANVEVDALLVGTSMGGLAR